MNRTMKTTAEFLSELSTLDIKIWVENERLRCNAPKEAMTPDIKAELAARKSEIIAFISQRNQALKSNFESIQPVSRQGNIPLSFAQQRLWFFNQLEPNNPAYRIPVGFRLTGKLNVPALSESIKEIIRRHEVLRTTFQEVDGEITQIVNQLENFNLSLIDLQSLPVEQQKEKLQNIVNSEIKKAFDLTQDLPIRVNLIQFSATDYVILLTMHHIVSDAWSRDIFIKELTALYIAFSQGQPSPLSELPIQYIDFTIWQRKWLQGENLRTHLNYWKEKLGGNLPILELPTDHSRPITKSAQGATQTFQLSSSLTEKIKDLSQKEGVTLFMLLLATFKVLLHRYTQQEDIIVGTPIANRNRAEIEGLIGFFVNTLALRTNFSNNPTFQELLQQVREITLEAYAHQDLPFEKLVEEIQTGRNLGQNPVFNVMFVLQNTTNETIKLPELNLQELPLEHHTSKFDLTLSISETETGLQGDLEYNTDIFNADRITRMLTHFQVLLEAIVNNPQQHLSELPLLTAKEQNQLLFAWNNTNINYALDTCLHELFENQVQQTPDAIAVVYDNKQLTYQELNQKANQLAHYLQKLGVVADTLVGICVERSLEMVIGILGILKAGGAYVPLDPNYPPERLAFMLEDCQTQILLSQKNLIDNLQINQSEVICLDSDWDKIAVQSSANLTCNINSHNLAYVIYTSGSTGKPKGVLINHSNVVRLFAAVQPWYNFHQKDVWTLFHSYAFDFSVWEIWGALIYGGKLVVVPYWVSRSPEEFYKLLFKEKVTVLNQTPSAFRQLINIEESTGEILNLNLRLVIFGGESLDIQSLRPWFHIHGDKSPQLVNMYGITETTVHVTYRPLTIDDLDKTASVIGRAIPDLQVYLLDQHQQLVPIGVVGELYIGGAGLARGYLNRPQLTNEKFIANYFSNNPEAKLYKTGDLGRYLPTGEIEYLGRIDDQVKIRGFRIELGEIAAVIEQFTDIKQAVVIVHENESNDQRLVAYLVTDANLESQFPQLRKFLQQKLPDYMIPSAFVVIDKLPLTPNGKLDRRALPTPEINSNSNKEKVLSRNPIEEKLAEIWGEILNLKQISIEDNFFEIGGHSLLATQVISKIRQIWQIEIPLSRLFEMPTIATLAAEISQTLQQKQPTSEEPTTAPKRLSREANRVKLSSLKSKS